MPDSWENRTILFIGYMVHKGMQSSIVKSYVSAIKKTLMNDGYEWKDNEIFLSSLVRACKLKNDIVRTRLPIHNGLLEMLLFEIRRIYRRKCQPYLEKLYSVIFALGYYGLMRVGELTQSPHVVKAKDVHLATNKEKLLVVLYSSKTHSKANRPQKIKIMANHLDTKYRKKRNFCPFKILADYIQARGTYLEDSEQFFVYKDHTPVTADKAHELLRTMLRSFGLQADLYDMHSLRIGRASDLIRLNYTIEQVKHMGRWKSNVVYRYIRQ